MQTVFVAITGMKYYHGTGYFQPGQAVQLVKEPDNPHDAEAIMAVMPPFGTVGYVANSVHTVPKGCRSAGRVYDTFEQEIPAVVRFVVSSAVIVELGAFL